MAPLLDPKGLIPPKWTGRLRAMALATANRARMCPRLGCLATLRRIRAHPLVAAPRGFVCPFVVAPRALGSPSHGDLLTLRPALSCAQGTNALGLAVTAFSASPAGSTPAVPPHLPLLFVVRCEGLGQVMECTQPNDLPRRFSMHARLPKSVRTNSQSSAFRIGSVSILVQHVWRTLG